MIILGIGTVIDDGMMIEETEIDTKIGMTIGGVGTVLEEEMTTGTGTIETATRDKTMKEVVVDVVNFQKQQANALTRPRNGKAHQVCLLSIVKTGN